MADQNASAIGSMVAEDAAPGSSMRGVTGHESAFGGSAAASIDTKAVDINGKPFDLPVDGEHKACAIKLHSIAKPHMRSFHLSWISFFTSFLSTFAAAPLIPIIRDDLNLRKPDLVNAGIAAVTGTIFARVVMGVFCDTFGPRYGHAFVMLGTAPAVFGMALVTGPGGFIAGRCLIGISLCTFVATQFWSTVMFNVKIVGTANATTGGWGNLGGGVTQFLMPVIYTGITKSHPNFTAWRFTYFFPGCMHIMVGLLVLFFAQDLPDGQYGLLKKAGTMQKASGSKAFLVAFGNYRMWCLMIIYAFCFGVELTMNNIVASYLFDQFDLDLQLAGTLGSLFGMMNLFARSIGGATSDYMAKKYGMRGRLWALWILQTAEGAACVLMGRLHSTLGGTVASMILFSVLVQASEGASFGVVPFITKRGLGVASGFIGAAGNAGSSITQAIFFKSGKYSTYDGISLMGIMIMAMTLSVIPIHFPMWGSMFFKGNPDAVTEEDYYGSDFTEEEKKAGMANAAMKFAAESKSERSGGANAVQSV